jgi:hypothetical protein
LLGCTKERSDAGTLPISFSEASLVPNHPCHPRKLSGLITSFRFSFVLPLALLALSFQFSTSAQASFAATNSSVDGIDCITSDNIIAPDSIASEDEKKQPAQDRNDPSESTGDLDDSDVGLDDLTADNSSRSDQDSLHFSGTGLDAVTLRAPGITRILLLTVHCFYGLHDHIRERAPPSRRSPCLAAAATQTLS